MFNEGDLVIFNGNLEHIAPGLEEEARTEVMDPDIPKRMYSLDTFTMTCYIEIDDGELVQCPLQYIEDYDG